MLRITSLDPQGDTQVIKVEGRLAARWVDELSRVASAPPRGAARVVLDVSGVTYVDDRGVELLRRLRAAGVELTEVSGFIASLVGGSANGDWSEGPQ